MPSLAALIATLAIALGAAASASAQPPLPDPQTIQQLNPAEGLDNAKPGVVYRAVAETKGLSTVRARVAPLRYTFALPEGFKPDEPRNLVIVLHGLGVDYRWGHARLAPGAFRPADIVVCVDGTSEADDAMRIFRLDNADAVVMRDFILEASRRFPTNRIILVGYRQGARFAVLFAGAFPRLIDGVVAIASGTAEGMPMTGGVQAVPLVLAHGTADEETPYALSLDAVNALTSQGHVMAMLRRLPGIDTLPDPAVLNPCVDWVTAMMTDDPRQALATARALLRPLGKASPVPPAFHMARAILRRFEVDPKAKREPGKNRVYAFLAKPGEEHEVTPELKKEAWDLALLIESHAQRHVQALKESGLKDPADLDKPIPARLGHLLALREDFRGVDSVEAYLTTLGFAERWTAHAEAALDIWGLFGDNAPTSPAARLDQAASAIPKAYLYEPMPPGFFAATVQWGAAEGPGAPSPDAKARAKVIEEWARAIEDGEKAYRDLWREFQAP